MKGLDKTTSFSYHVDGQLAERRVGNEPERFFWDGLALVRRNDTSYLNEPSVTGGNPILADDKVMFNDMLGNTLGIYGKDLQEVKRTSFGSGDETGFFTGKPYVKELGAVFLFRNYRSDLGKWQTADPLGYPDGWNNFAYCNNWINTCIDRLGTDIYHLVDPNGAVASAGHSAWIVGNDGAYTTYDYRPAGSDSSVGSSTSAGSPEVKTFSNIKDAIDYLNSGREDGHKYTQAQGIETSAADDTVARWAANDFMSEDYSLTGHNCYHLGRSMISEINRVNGTNYNISDSWIPNTGFEENQSKNWSSVAVPE